jgi:H+-translocating diphosphatase
LDLAESCKTGAATNIISGLALGYKSTIVPCFVLAIIIFVNFKLLGMLGVALGAIGMLSNLAISLAIDAYGPISDNAGGIAEMSLLGDHVRNRTDALDSAGNTTAAIGKGFAIGSAALVSLSLYGAFCTRAANVQKIEILDSMVMASLLIGAMLPYWFSAMTMQSVGTAAMDMVQEVRRQLRDEDIRNEIKDPDYKACIRISTTASLREMIGPGLLVLGTPLIFGFFFGTKAVAGLLPGSLISSVQMAISASNSGGAWDNAKKFFESQKMKNTEEHKAAVVGDTVGDPLKDTSGPSLNILMKLMAILSLVFAGAFGDGWLHSIIN